MEKLEWKIPVLAGFRIKYVNGATIHVSILSRRASLMVFGKDWPRPVFKLEARIHIGSRFYINGFQPDTGYMIAVRSVRRI